MFELNPLNLPDAQVQHIIMLVVAGLLGFIIGYVSRQRMIRQLEGDLASTAREVDDCYRTKTVVGQGDDEETIVLNRIRARAGELNFNRIGLASAATADDLKVIVGVGPFLEKKLHAIGIYTFRQIASFTPEDIEKVNDIIEFFPGRIERDNWVGQAAELAKKK
jgi:predicted flap endonuclease-1-like 5' DNA nuclease